MSSVDSIINKVWGLSLRDVNLQDLVSEIVAFKKSDENFAGSLRLIVSKNGDYFFQIPSSYGANANEGISWRYEIIVNDIPEKQLMNCVSLLTKYLGFNSAAIFQLIKNRDMSNSLGTYFLHEPLTFAKELSQLHLKGMLKRPDNLGFYEF
jgi:hypothetical protein